MPIQIAQEQHADDVLSSDPFALLTGMLLDESTPWTTGQLLRPRAAVS